MKILFVTDVINKWYGSEPLGIMYLSSVARAAGHETALTTDEYREASKSLLSFKPDVVAYSVTTGAHTGFLELNRRLKNSHKFFALFGGPHPTFFPEFIEEDGVDAVCLGEGEEALIELLEALDRGGDLKSIPNIWFKEAGKVYKNAVRPLEQNLDSLPFPDREIIYARYNRPEKYKMAKFIIGRGCPYNCTYCFNHAFAKLYTNQKRVRLRSVDNVLDEVSDVLAKYPAEFVGFTDDIFIINMDWLREFAEKYRQRIGRPYWCNVRANLVNEEVLDLLKASGCHSVVLAVEAGNERLRNQILKRNMTGDQIVNACKLLRQKGIRFVTNNILGFPGGSLENDIETLELNIKCRPFFAAATLFQPYPKTELGDYAIEMGFFDGDIDKIGETSWRKSVIVMDNKDKVINLQKLFSIIVEFPMLNRLTRTLIRLPLTGLYELVRKFWWGYCYKFRIYPVNINLKAAFKGIIELFRAHNY